MCLAERERASPDSRRKVGAGSDGVCAVVTQPRGPDCALVALVARESTLPIAEPVTPRSESVVSVTGGNNREPSDRDGGLTNLEALPAEDPECQRLD